MVFQVSIPSSPLKAIVKGRFGDQIDRIAPLVYADDCIQKASSLVCLSIADQGDSGAPALLQPRLIFIAAGQLAAIGELHIGCGSPPHRQLSLGVVY